MGASGLCGLRPRRSEQSQQAGDTCYDDRLKRTGNRSILGDQVNDTDNADEYDQADDDNDHTNDVHILHLPLSLGEL